MICRGISPSAAPGKTPEDWRKSFYYHFYEYPGWHFVKRHYGVRTERYKLMHFYHDIDAWELYDLKTDPAEMNNVYGNPDYAEVQEKMTQELKRVQEKCGDSHDRALEIVGQYPHGSLPGWYKGAKTGANKQKR
ncbi:MAG: DUF4976 domain-containing protein [candidate division KSB1 bacterium]|nr:DUF4976 domain-containing protein [candidate division KSB1 bacterium]